MNQEPSVTALLLKRGADIEATADGGLTPLMAAVQVNPNPSVSALLLDYGANVEARDEEDGTPLHWLLDSAPNWMW